MLNLYTFNKLYLILQILALFQPNLIAISIDNGLIGEPTVRCGAFTVELTLSTRNVYSGRIFVKGYSQELNCQFLGDANNSNFVFTVNFDQCGMTRTRETNGITISTTIVISFHSIFITKVDRAYRVNCFYAEKRQEIVSQALDVDPLITQSINLMNEGPICRYDILSGGANGAPVRYAKIGDLIYHKWTCSAPFPNTYCMRVHSCTVNDGQGGLPFYVLDSNGCESDEYVFQNLYYIDDLTAGQYAYAFKFADRPTLHFNCQVELTLKSNLQHKTCRTVQPNCPSVNSKSKIIEHADEYSKSNSNAAITKTTTNYNFNIQNKIKTTASGSPYHEKNNNFVPHSNYNNELSTQINNYGNTNSSYDLHNNTNGYDNSQELRQFRLNSAKYSVKDNDTFVEPPLLLYPNMSSVENRQNYHRIPANYYYSTVKTNRLMSSPNPDNISLPPTVKSQQTTVKSSTTSKNNVQNIADFFDENTVSTAPIDSNYMDEMDAFISGSKAQINFINAPERFSRRRKAANYGKSTEGPMIISDLRLPEQTLLVVDIDDNALAFNLLNEANSAEILTNISENNFLRGSISYAFFLAFSLIIITITALLTSFLTYILLKTSLNLSILNVLLSPLSNCACWPNLSSGSSYYSSNGRKSDNSSDSGVYVEEQIASNSRQFLLSSKLRQFFDYFSEKFFRRNY